MTGDRTHGSSGYFNGCRCNTCVMAAKDLRKVGTFEAYMAGRTKTKPLFYPDDRTKPFDPDDERHGSLGGYTRGCRCEWCKQAGIAYRNYKRLDLKLPKGWNARYQEVENAPSPAN